jgi:hypothetical protein
MRHLLLLLAALTFAAPAFGQLSVDLKISRRTYVRYEPVLVTVAMTNLSGRDLQLRDGEAQWFGFQVNAAVDENLIPPRNPDYTLEPLELKAGETVKRTVNLNSLFNVGEIGIYRIKATIYSADLNKFFTSRTTNIDVTEGRLISTQTVGVPPGGANGGAMHTVSLLSYQGVDKRYLYARVENRELGTVYCTYRLGHMIDGVAPEMQFDAGNSLYVLHLIGPKTYTLSKIGVNGEFLGQSTYVTTKTRPYLRRLADGKLQIVGGRREVIANTPESSAPPVVKLSDRPAGLPAR